MTGAGNGGSGVPLLVCDTGGKTFAVPLSQVRETMRPLPAPAAPWMPEFVLGVARIRGAAVPVVDSGLLIGSEPVQAGRWITLAAGEGRCVALAVQNVTGIRTLDEDDLEPLPPLLHRAGRQLFAAVSTLDPELLVTLETSRLIPDDVWDRLTGTAGVASS